MRAPDSYKGARSAPGRQRGVAAVEFAFVVLIFLTLVFGVMELARVMYICNTLQEVSRRAAALATKTDFSDSTAMQRVRERAIFRNAPGFLAFAEPVTDAHVVIDYLAVTRDGAALKTTPIPKGSLPADPARNQEICVSDPNDAACIRLVRVRICRARGAECDPINYESIISLVPFPLPLPLSTTIVTAESLGRAAGVPPLP